MSIRIKIASIACVFLVIFGIVIGVSTILQSRLAAEVQSTFQYNTPIRTLIADFDVLSDEYELIILRLVRHPDFPDGFLVQSETARARKDAEQMAEDLRQLKTLMDQAIADKHLPEQCRLLFSEMLGSLPFIERQFEPFIQTGERVLKAFTRDSFNEARKLSLEFQKTESAFGPDTALIRQKLATLQESLGKEIDSRVKAVRYLSFGLFVLAACLGIGAVAVVATNIIRTLRRLIEGAKAVQEGKLTVSIPIASKDEVGELADAFNHMVSEIRAKERIQNTFYEGDGRGDRGGTGRPDLFRATLHQQPGPRGTVQEGFAACRISAERLILPPTVGMDRPRNEFFARPRFARDEDGGIGGCNPPDITEHGRQGVALTDDLLEIVDALDLLLEVEVLLL
jgi:adenylate cyclase